MDAGNVDSACSTCSGLDVVVGGGALWVDALAVEDASHGCGAAPVSCAAIGGKENDMAERIGNGAAAPDGASARFAVLAQYTKDFSFENPNAPRTLAPQPQSPKISLQINVNVRQLAPNDFEVSLMLEGGAGEGADALFKFELNYAGVFRVENIPAEQIQPLVMIEGPRLLFPFARQIVADSVRAGGYPPATWPRRPGHPRRSA